MGMKAKSFMDAGRSFLMTSSSASSRSAWPSPTARTAISSTVCRARSPRREALEADGHGDRQGRQSDRSRRGHHRAACPAAAFAQAAAPATTSSTIPPKGGVCDLCGGELAIRKDDAPETVRDRLKVYHEQTEPLVGFYRQRGKLVRCRIRAPSRPRLRSSSSFWRR